MPKYITNAVRWALVTSSIICMWVVYVEEASAQRRPNKLGRTTQRKSSELRQQVERLLNRVQQLESEAQQNKGKKTETEKIDKEIKQSCEVMEKSILTANSSFAEFPYNENELPSDFNERCITGFLSWKSTRKYAKDDPVKNEDVFGVDFQVLDLRTDSIIQEHGRVEFFMKNPLIKILSNPTGSDWWTILREASKKPTELEWWLDLRNSEYGEEFTSNLKTLYANLDKKKKLSVAPQ